MSNAPRKAVNKLIAFLAKNPNNNSIQELANKVPSGNAVHFVGQHPQFFDIYEDQKKVKRVRIKQVTSKTGYKWRMCVVRHFRGQCPKGDTCDFWHGPKDTRDNPKKKTAATTPSPVPASAPSQSNPTPTAASKNNKPAAAPQPIKTYIVRATTEPKREVGGKICYLVPQEKKCHEIVNDLRSQEVIAVDCEGICLGVNGTLCLIQIATASHVYVFDICSSAKADIVETLKPIFESNKILKVLHGAENDLVGLSSVGIVNDNFEDTQALYEILAKDLRKMKDAKSSIGLQSLMEVYGFKHELKAKMTKIYKGRPDIWAKRPLTEEMIEYAACDVASLTTVYKKLKEEINAEIMLKSKTKSMLKSKTKSMSKKQKSLLAEKTYAGALNNTPLNTKLRLAFTDDKQPDRRLILEGSSESSTPLKSNTNEIREKVRSDNEKEEQKLLKLLPTEINQAVKDASCGSINTVIEIVVDLGRVPIIRFSDSPDVLLDGEEIMDMEPFVTTILANSQRADFSQDNRIGIEGSLHRIAAIKSTDNRVTGLTYRIGRHFPHSAEIFTDLIARVAPQKVSVLLVGEPGRGKTTLLREFARLLADEYRQRVMIVDTSNEIGGDGDIAHKCIGRARRMPVVDKASQHNTMVEAVQNHNPTVIIIDEIGTPKEVVAAKTISQRGVSLIGTAHGTSFDSLMKNPELVPLLGGIKEVFLSDREATKNADGTKSKVKHERGGSPTFNIIIEIISKNEFVIYDNVAQIVDAKLNRKRYVTERRWFEDDQMFCKLEEHDTWA